MRKKTLEVVTGEEKKKGRSQTRQVVGKNAADPEL